MLAETTTSFCWRPARRARPNCCATDPAFTPVPTRKRQIAFSTSPTPRRLRFGKAANDMVRIRLFKSEGENRFTHVHRVVAEYLGAKWLVRCFEDGVSQNRIFGLFRQREGVPTSLRGLHAWIAHFSDDLATPLHRRRPLRGAALW